ncbi:MAG: acylphosphatase [Candidatus Daviesbacteria bacterium]
MVKHIRLTVLGKVQGVFFRSSSQKKAQEFGLTGFAKNIPDGKVYIEIEGEEKNLEKFIAWCQKGPPFAKVENVQVTEEEVKNFSEFKII